MDLFFSAFGLLVVGARNMNAIQTLAFVAPICLHIYRVRSLTGFWVNASWNKLPAASQQWYAQVIRSKQGVPEDGDALEMDDILETRSTASTPATSQTRLSVVLAGLEYPVVHKQFTRTTLKVGCALGIVFGLCLFFSTLGRALRQDQQCRDMVGDVLWDAAYPKILFRDGMLSSTSCGFDKVSSLDLSNKGALRRALYTV